MRDYCGEGQGRIHDLNQSHILRTTSFAGFDETDTRFAGSKHRGVFGIAKKADIAWACEVERFHATINGIELTPDDGAIGQLSKLGECYVHVGKNEK